MYDVEITREEALSLLNPARRSELRERAHELTLRSVERRFDFCAIINAKSGKCTENCKWCAQSAHWRTGCETYGWVGTDACVKAAKEAEANGADRIGIVTSGRSLSDEEVDGVCEALKEMRKASKIGLCASLGLLTVDQLKALKAAGLERIHCNLETAPSLFPELCTTHSTADKIATLRAAKELGFQICCGGIIGMGESDEQLVEFAFALKEIAPDSIPVNVLHPIDGTPLGNRGVLDPERVVDSVALLRLVNPSTPLRFAGGRRDMSDETAAKCIYVGMSAGIAGALLTTPGADFDDDRELAVRAGYSVGAASKALAEARDYFSKDRFATENGMVLEARDKTHAVTSMTITDRHRNAFGGVMGGAIFTLADFAFAALTNDREHVTVGQQVSINYFSQPKGTRLIATARFRKNGQKSCVANVDVTDDTGRDIAQFVATGFKLTHS